MRPSIRYALLFMCAIPTLQAQQNVNNLERLTIFPIASIDGSAENFEDLHFLKDILKDNRILLLGEQSHGDGATFEAKVRLVKFLHQELGYDIVSFESGLYDNYKAFESVSDTNYRESPLKESIFSIWSDTREFEPLLKYVHKMKQSTRPLLVTGFDCQAGDIFKDKFLNDLTDILKNEVALGEDETTILEEVISAGPEFILSGEKDSVLFISTCDKIRRKLEALPNYGVNPRARLLRQALVSWMAQLKWEMDVLNDVDVAVQNPRDLQMARNLIFLSEFYPDRKIICWGAAYHFANRIELYQNTSVTRSYISKLDSLQHSHEPFDLDASLKGAVPMGRVLKEHFGGALYSLAFSSYEGEFGMLGSPSTSLDEIQPPPGSIEDVIAKHNHDFAFVDYRQMKGDAYFYSSSLGNLPIYAPWHKVFDGLFFIRTSHLPSFPAYKIDEVKPVTQIAPIPSAGERKNSKIKQMVDNVTGQGIGYASIYLLNSSRGVVSNAGGEFAFNIPQSERMNKIILSSVGYQTDTLSVEEYFANSRFELKPVATQLPEVEVRAKPLRAKEIIKLAEKRIHENYYQSANQQEFFCRVKYYKEDSVISNEEATVLVYNPFGYQSSTNATRKLKGQILQFRNTTDNEDLRNSWAGVGSLWLIYTHDLILDKDNVLHRPAYYDLTLNGTTAYENRKVFDISFDCKKPGAYTTGFGYPSPISAKGKIYIDVETYAVLKVETLIQRRPYRNKRRPGLLLDPYGHHLVQTYKQFDGKYFLSYSRQVHFSKWTNTTTASHDRHLEVRELLSTAITTTPDGTMTVPLTNIKSAKPKADPYFWANHNIKLEDNVEENYEIVGLGKKDE